ncbi:unnamed protein product [Alopecurus aequalis]
MRRLQSCILARLLSFPPATYPIPISPLHRLLSASTADPIPGFAVEQYLVDSCGLSRRQALRASAKLAHLNSPSNPDAVLAFLAGLGLPRPAVAAAVAGDPELLCADVDETLAPVAAEITAHGLSHAEVARLASLGCTVFRCRSAVSNLPYYISLFGTQESLLRLVKHSPRLLGYSLDNVVKPNVAFLRECSLGDYDFLKVCLASPRILATKLERLRAMVTFAEGLGAPRGSRMFWNVLRTVSFVGEWNFTAKMDYLKEIFRWSDAEVSTVLCRSPQLLHRSDDRLRRLSEFLISEVGLEPAEIAQHSLILTVSLDGRLRPRYSALKFLKENGLLKYDPSYSTVFMLSEKVFMERYICPRKEAAPHLAEDYLANCRGEVPTRFIFD